MGLDKDDIKQLIAILQRGLTDDDESDDDSVEELESTSVKKTKPKNKKKEESEYINDQVLSSHIVWTPIGNQAKRFEIPISVVHDDILVAKLRPGQVIDYILLGN